MPTEWFIERKTGVAGPYTAAKLQALAQRGEVTPDDFIRQGMDGRPVPASKVKGLFPSTPIRSEQPPAKSPPTIPVANETSVEVPPAEDAASNSTTKAKEDRLKNASAKVQMVVNRLVTDSRAAARLTAKRTERLRITQVSLPQAYRDLGKAIHSAQQYRDTFPDLYADIDESLQRIQEFKQARPANETDGFSGRAKAVAATARNAAAAKAVSLKLAGQLRSLGEAAYEKDGQSSGHSELASAIAGQYCQLAKLDAEIVAIEEPYAGRVVTSRRLAIGGTLLIGLVLYFCLSSLMGSRSTPTVASTDSKRPAESLANSNTSSTDAPASNSTTPLKSEEGTSFSLSNGRLPFDKFLTRMKEYDDLKIHSVVEPQDVSETPFAELLKGVVEPGFRLHIGAVEQGAVQPSHVSVVLAETEPDKQIAAIILAATTDLKPTVGHDNLRTLGSVMHSALPEANFVEFLRTHRTQVFGGRKFATETFGKAAIAATYKRADKEFLLIITAVR